MKTQQQKIAEHFEQGRSLTPIQALNRFGCFRLAAVVFKLNKKGMRINSEIVQKGKKRFAKYVPV